MGLFEALFVSLIRLVTLGLDIVAFFVMVRLVTLHWRIRPLLAFDQAGEQLVDPLVAAIQRVTRRNWLMLTRLARGGIVGWRADSPGFIHPL